MTNAVSDFEWAKVQFEIIIDEERWVAVTQDTHVVSREARDIGSSSILPTKTEGEAISAAEESTLPLPWPNPRSSPQRVLRR